MGFNGDLVRRCQKWQLFIDKSKMKPALRNTEDIVSTL